jgi:hypothetical protein
MSVRYLEKRIDRKRVSIPKNRRLTADGYTPRAGSPSDWLILLEGESRWRRVYCWQFSNASTLFVRIGGQPIVVRDYELIEAEREYEGGEA